MQKLKDGEVAVSGYVSEIESLKRCVEEAKAETRMQAEQHAALASGQVGSCILCVGMAT